MLSRRGLRVNQITSEGEPLFWINNLRWYFPVSAPRPSYRFILVQGLDPAALRGRFGAPSEIREVAGSVLWLYDEASAIRTASLRADIDSIVERTRLRAW